MSEVNVKNKCQATTWEIVETSGNSPDIIPGNVLTINRSELTDPNSLPIQLQRGDANGVYTYTISFQLTNNQFNIPLPPDDALSLAGPINVSIGDGQGEV